MPGKPNIAKLLWVFSAIFSLLAPSLAMAGEVTVFNCSKQDVPFTVKSYDSNDTIRFTPSGRATIRAGNGGRFSCATEECVAYVHYPTQIVPYSPLGMGNIDLEATPKKLESRPNKRAFCVRFDYNDNGRVQSLSYVNTGASTCSCP